MKKLIPAICISMLLFTHCKVVKYTPDKLPTTQIVFGDGGGFAGIETSYTLLQNGQLFKQVGTEGKYEELRPIKSKEAKEFFKKVASLQLYKMDIEKPGNLYYFIREANDAIDSRVTWGAGDYLPPKALISTYKDLKALAQSQEVIREIAKTAATKKAKEKKKEEKKTDW
ncbi:MAG TPA: hypothetical protein ENJ95_21435 [Bacteroidetes bacterium]|nr:hypothetical protein [Bacteroidota bacterium]